MSLFFRGRSVKRFCSFALTGCAVVTLSAIAAAAPGVPGDGRISFVRDLTGNTVVRGSTKLGFAEIARPGCTWFSLTGNGRYLALACDSNEFVTGDNNGLQDVFVKDLQGTGAVTLVSRVAGGAAANNVSGGPILSRDGTWIAFASYADNFVNNPTPDNNDAADVYRAQRQ